MQIEPYNLKKAFALEKLNDINLNVLQAETILKLYTLEYYVVIFTAKRVICVQELTDEYFDRSDRQILKARVGKNIYKFWFIFYDDIMKLKYLQTKRQATLNDEYNEEDQNKSMIYSLRILFSETSSANLLEAKTKSSSENDIFGMSDFRVAFEDIHVDVKDLKVLKRIYKQLQMRSTKNLE